MKAASEMIGGCDLQRPRPQVVTAAVADCPALLTVMCCAGLLGPDNGLRVGEDRHQCTVRASVGRIQHG